MNLDGELVLDPGVLAELRAATGDDDAFIVELVETYVSEGETSMAALLAAAGSGDCAAIVRPAHSLKSTSASLGAMRMAAVCRAIEEAGRMEQTETLRDGAELARQTWDATLTAFTDTGLRS